MTYVNLDDGVSSNKLHNHIIKTIFPHIYANLNTNKLTLFEFKQGPQRSLLAKVTDHIRTLVIFFKFYQVSYVSIAINRVCA